MNNDIIIQQGSNSRAGGRDFIENQINYISNAQNIHKINIYFENSNTIIELFETFNSFRIQLENIYKSSMKIYENELEVKLNLNNDITIGLIDRIDKNEHLFSNSQLKQAHLLLVSERNKLSNIKEYLLTIINEFVYNGIAIPNNDILIKYYLENYTRNVFKSNDLLKIIEGLSSKVTETYLSEKDILINCYQKINKLCEKKEELRNVEEIQSTVKVGNKTSLGKMWTILQEEIILNKKELFFAFDETKYYRLLEKNTGMQSILLRIREFYPYFTDLEDYKVNNGAFIYPKNFKSSGLANKYLTDSTI